MKRYHMIYPEDRWVTETELIQHAVDDVQNHNRKENANLPMPTTPEAAILAAHDLGTATFTGETRDAVIIRARDSDIDLTHDELVDVREKLIRLRNSCLGPAIFDPAGGVILSHAVRWLSFKVEGKPYEPPTD
jgi:hypothetical protein